jgi:hypothetical protein
MSDSEPRYQKTPEWRIANARLEGAGRAGWVPEKRWTATDAMRVLLVGFGCSEV